MRLRKVLIGISGCVALVGLVWGAANWDHVRHFPPIISSYYAKEMCSCLFVVGQTEERCHNIVRQWVPISSCKIDPVEKTVTVSGLGCTNRAYFVDERFGCVLEDLD